MTVKVKICGLTRLDDTLAAIDAGADCLGFNFYPDSPRYIAPADCTKIQSAIRNRRSAITTVGIFVNSPAAHIEAILNECELDLAQLSGDEPGEVISLLHRRAYKAIRPRSIEEAERAADYYISGSIDPPALLVDAAHGRLYGGTGQIADWLVARRLTQRYPLLLAGGLTPDNVAQAVREVQPWGVDVASGVESSPGKKDHRKMIEFVQAVRNQT
jgi:phosphoribosylanthranilate isomerase